MTDDENARVGYDAALHSAAIFDCSSAGKLEVTDREATDFLHNLSTNDIKGLAVGAGCEAFFCNVKARALFHTRIYRGKSDGRDALWIDVTPGYNDALLKHLDRHLIAEQVELSDRTAQLSQFHLAGPAATDILARALQFEVPALELHQHMVRNMGPAVETQIRCNPLLGVTGYDIVCPVAQRDDVWNCLPAAGATVAQPAAWQWLRIEAGTPVYGPDIDENRFVVEIDRPKAISYSKGCYLGQEPIVMARDRAGFVNRSFRGLRISEPVLAGAKLFAKDEVGVVTSATESPRWGPIALGYLKRGFETVGTEVHVGSPEGPIGTVATLPFRAEAAR